MIAEAIRRVEGQAKAQGIALTCTLDPIFHVINGDPLRLRAVFDNILSNALKYTPAGGTVTVEAHQTDLSASGVPASVTIAVSDTGPGVPASFRSRIFEKFYRLEHHQNEAHSVARGAGIGLYMCRQIVELHGRHISCRASVDGRGACIVVVSACAQPERHAARQRFSRLCWPAVHQLTLAPHLLGKLVRCSCNRAVAGNARCPA